ncbi:pyrolysin [Ceratobasidium sp. AG-Ba]|nr:pyrolysin [Ceratobasidium sp. AG-Ba]
MDTFGEWLEAQSNLKQAISIFLERSTALCDVDPILSESTVPSVDSNINSLEVAHRQCQDAFFMLKRFLNNSKTRTPINALPNEVLVQIFSFSILPVCYFKRHAVPTYGRYSHDPSIDLSAVCSRWRWIMCNHGWFWSHVDMALEVNQDNYESWFTRELWLERSKGVPLHIHYGPVIYDHEHIWGLVDVLRPYAKQISTITFPELPSIYFFNAVVNLCREHGNLESVKGLDICDLQQTSDFWETLLPFSSYFHRLEQIELCQPGNMVIGLDQILCLLSRNPSLRTVRLHGISSPEDKDFAWPRFDLPCLHLLGLFHADDDSLRLLLDSIRSVGTSEFHLGIDASDDAQAIAAVTSFMARSTVTSLQLTQPHRIQYTTTRPFFQETEKLDTIVLQLTDFQPAAPQLDELRLIKEHGLLPKLKTLCLIARTCTLTEQGPIQETLPVLGIQKLILVNFSFQKYQTDDTKKRFINDILDQGCSVLGGDFQIPSDEWDAFFQQKVIGRSF